MRSSGKIVIAFVVLSIAAALVSARVLSSRNQRAARFLIFCDRYLSEKKSFPIHTAALKLDLDEKKKIFFVRLNAAGRARSASPGLSIRFDEDKRVCELTLTAIPAGDHVVKAFALDSRERVIGESAARFTLNEQAAPIGIEISASLRRGASADEKKAFLCDAAWRRNAAYSEDGKTFLRWPEKRIAVHAGDVTGAAEAISAWRYALNGSVELVDSPTADAPISFTVGDAVDAEGRPGCGHAENFAVFSRTVIHLAPEGFANCPAGKQTAMHEMGHALGFFGHTEDAGTLMADTDAEWRKMQAVDAFTSDVLKLVYENPAGSTLKDAGCDFETLSLGAAR